MLKKLAFTVMMATALSATACYAREEIRIVGSSTLYPFITVAAEEFGSNSTFKTPIIEATGTGGGFKLFCAKEGQDSPDIANASRAIKDSEKTLCQQNGVSAITGIKIGYDGIILAHALKASDFNLSRRDIFLALARSVPQNGKMVNNFYTTWKQVNAALPDIAIQVYGPPPTSGTRDAFVELVMEKGCNDVAEVVTLFPKEEDRKKACGALREDGKFVEAGENDNLIVQKLTNNPTALGIFGYSYLEENSQIVKGVSIEDIKPELSTIVSGKYPVSRPLFVYVKNGHIGKAPGIKEFLTELTSDAAIGDNGYLISKGLIPLTAKERKESQEKVAKLAASSK